MIQSAMCNSQQKNKTVSTQHQQQKYFPMVKWWISKYQVSLWKSFCGAEGLHALSRWTYHSNNLATYETVKVYGRSHVSVSATKVSDSDNVSGE